MIEIPAGPCTIGAPAHGFAYDNERPLHRTDVRGYLIGRTPITNASYLTFVEGGGYERREWWSDEGWAWKEEYDISRPGGWTADRGGQWRLGRLERLDPLQPVVHVSWFEADAFARAHGARLPDEREWEKAATWDQERQQARRYPWGEQPPVAGVHANVDRAAGGPEAAGAHPEGASPYGCLGMIGDVWEWTSSQLRRISGFRALSVRGVLAGLLRRRLSRPARRLVGHLCPGDQPHVSQLGLPSAPSDLLGLPDRQGPPMKAVVDTEAIRIDSWLSEAEERSLGNDVLDGLTRPFKELQPKHFYDARGSELFERICELDEYYPTRTEKSILATRADEIVAAVGRTRIGRARLRVGRESEVPARRDDRGRRAAPLRAV